MKKKLGKFSSSFLTYHFFRHTFLHVGILISCTVSIYIYSKHLPKYDVPSDGLIEQPCTIRVISAFFFYFFSQLNVNRVYLSSVLLLLYCDETIFSLLAHKYKTFVRSFKEQFGPREAGKRNTSAKLLLVCCNSRNVQCALRYVHVENQFLFG